MATSNSLLTLPNFDINSLIRDMPGFAIIKDLDSTYLSANLNTVNEFGLKNPEHLFGYSDLTIPHPLSNNGQLYRNLDHEVIQTGEAMKGICTFPFQGSIRPYQFRKSTLKDLAGKNIGTYSHAEECLDTILLQFLQSLIATHPLKNWKNPANATNSFILNKQYRGIQLTPLESSCLFYLIRQKKKAEIAHFLNLPIDAINVFIENIKAQLNVTTIADILEISIEKGYLNIVPSGIVSQLYSRHHYAINSEVKLLQHNLSVDKAVKFTNREIDCAKLLIQGKKIKEIASAIHLSPRTVETHINNLKMKLASRDKVELVIKLRDLLR